MKKIFAILSAAAVALTMMVSCQEKEEPHVPGQPDVENCYGIFFPVQDATGYHIYDPAAPLTATFTVGRSNTAGAITVPVVVDASEEIFEIAPVTFADGQAETTFKVDFPNVEDGKEYSLHIEVTDPQYASIYSNKTTFMDFSFMRVEMLDFLNPKTKEPAEITLNEGWWGEVHKAKMKYYEVNDVRTCTIYSIEEGNGIWGDTVDATLQFRWYTKVNNSEDNNILEVPKQYMGFDYDGWGSKPVEQATSPVYVYDYYSYWIERGESESTLGTFLQFAADYGNPDGSYPIGYYDGNGGFFFNLRYYIPGLGGFSPDPYEFVAIVDGFTRVDYSLGIQTDFSFNGVSPVYVETGMDVASIKYAVYEGELTNIQCSNKANAIIDGTEAATEFKDFQVDEEEAIKYATLELSPETTGTYTIVAVAYDKDGNNQTFASASFKHVTAGDQEDYAVDVSVFTEDTPARYTSYHKYDSFAYGVAGKDLTEVHVAIFKLDDIAGNTEAAFNAVKADAKGSYKVSDEILAQINGEGGYYTVVPGMPAKTDLVVIAWATNGDLENWAYDTYTTEKLPYVWNSLGKGLINDGFFNYLFNNKPETKAACDVYEEANTPGLYMVTGFQCAVAAGFFGIDEATMAQYEGGNWRNAEVVVDATNPNAVVIEDQDYGILVNSSYGFFMIGTEPTGTLKDGVITWPAEEMYVGMAATGQWYYGNSEGTFSITLPSAVPTSAPAAVPARNGEVKNVELSNGISPCNGKTLVFERDPQPVKVAAKVSYTRMEKKLDRTLSTK